jgi:antirestriction protein
MFEVSVSHKPSLFTVSITIDDSCFTSDDIKNAFLDMAENNSIEDYESIDRNDIQIDYSDLPKWLSPGNLEDFIENYPNSHYVDMDIWEAAHDCGIEFSDVDDAYAGEFNSDEEFAQDLCEQLGDIPRDFPSYIHIDWESTARDLLYDYCESNGHYFRNM